MPTAQQLITDAHVHLEVLPAGSTLGADLSAQGLAALNRLLDSWLAEQIAIAGQAVQTITMTGAANYALGTRPVKIESAVVADASGVEQQARLVNSQQWAQIKDKSRTGLFAEAVWYDGGYPTGNVYVTPKPSAGTLILRVLAPLTAVATLGTSVAVAPGVEQAIVYNLAVALAGSLGKPVPPSVAALAASSKDSLSKLSVDVFGVPFTQAAPKG